MQERAIHICRDWFSYPNRKGSVVDLSLWESGLEGLKILRLGEAEPERKLPSLEVIGTEEYLQNYCKKGCWILANLVSRSKVITLSRMIYQMYCFDPISEKSIDKCWLSLGEFIKPVTYLFQIYS